MKLVALKAAPMVPWFDEISKFRELGIFNMGASGLFVVAEYYGSETWVNELDPQMILDSNRPKVMVFTTPELVMAGDNFELSGAYPEDGVRVVMVGTIPVSVSVTGGKFVKKISLPAAGTYHLSCRDVDYIPTTLLVAM